MMKKLLAAILAVSMIAGMTACSSADEQNNETAEKNTTVAEGEPVTLSLYFWGNQSRNDLTQKAVDLYMSENPNVTINVEFTDWSGYWDKMAATASGGTMPDIVQMDYGYIGQYTSSESLYDLTEYLEDGTIDTTYIEQSIIDSGTVDGKFYGLSLGSNAQCFLYDKEITDEAGVTIPEQMTMEELYDICKQVYEKTGVKTYLDGSINMATNICRADGGHIWEDVPAGNTKGLTDFFNYVDQFQKAEFSISPEILVEKNPEVVESKPIIDKTVWNDFAHSNQYIAVAEACGRDIGISMLPTTEDAVSNPMYLKPSQFFSVSANTEHPKEAAEFINWFVNSVECNQILGGERGVPVSSEVRNALKEQMSQNPDTAANVLIYDYIDRVSKVATTMDDPNPAGTTECGTLLNTYTENVRYGKTAPEEAAQNYLEEAKSIMEEAAKD